MIYTENLNIHEMRIKSMVSVKDQMIKVINDQPEDSSYDDILRELVFRRMIERGLEDSRAGRGITHEELEQRIKSW
jgi:hypothetical protein